jgi:DNA-binding NtrC family response regulator
VSGRDRLGSRSPVPIGKVPRTLPEIMAAYERIVIIEALQRNGFSRKRTAVSLGITRGLLYARIRLLKINLGELPSSSMRGRPRTKGIP